MPAALQTFTLDQFDDAGSGAHRHAQNPRSAHSGQPGCEDVTPVQRILMATEPLLAATRRGRGRAEAFARSLHSKLRSLSGSEPPETTDGADSGDGGGPGGGGGLGDPDDCHVRLCSSSSGDDVFFDLDLTPQSPQEEVSPSELEVLMLNSLHIETTNQDEESGANEDDSGADDADEAARSGTSPQSDCSSDYFDPESFEDARADTEETPLLVKACNGIASESANHLRSFGLACAEIIPSSDPQSTSSSDTNIPCDPWQLRLSPEDVTEALRQVLASIKNEKGSESTDSAGSDVEQHSVVPLDIVDIVLNPNITPPLSDGAVKVMIEAKLRLSDGRKTECSEREAATTNDAVLTSILEAQEPPEIVETAPAEGKTETELKPEDQPSQESPQSTESDEQTPRVRRCSSLKTGKTPPGTPCRKKIVRFADVLGLDLADVRTFLDEIPRIPSSAYNDLSSAEAPPAELTPLPQLALSFGTAPGRCLVAAFQQPGGQPDFLDRIRERQVCLENAIVRDPTLLSIAGTVRVRNLDFHKSVYVRYTTDNWRSYADLQATYVPNSCDGFSDKFTFVLYAAHTMAVGQRLEFAVRFQCKGQQFWDANGSSNYAFECLPAASPTSAMSMPMSMMASSPDETTWHGSFY